MDIRIRFNLYTHLHKTQKAEKKKNSDGPVSYFAPYPTIPTPGLRQANIWIKMYKS